MNKSPLDVAINLYPFYAASIPIEAYGKFILPYHLHFGYTSSSEIFSRGSLKYRWVLVYMSDLLFTYRSIFLLANLLIRNASFNDQVFFQARSNVKCYLCFGIISIIKVYLCLIESRSLLSLRLFSGFYSFTTLNEDKFSLQPPFVISQRSCWHYRAGKFAKISTPLIY